MLVVAQEGNHYVNYEHALLWKNGAVIDLHNAMTNITILGPGGFTETPVQSFASAINNNEQIAGTMIFLAKNDSWYTGAEPQKAFLWQNNTVTSLGGYTFARALAINNNGAYALTANYFRGGYLSANVSSTCLGTAHQSEVTTINNLGESIVTHDAADGSISGVHYFLCGGLNSNTDLGADPTPPELADTDPNRTSLNDNTSYIVKNFSSRISMIQYRLQPRLHQRPQAHLHRRQRIHLLQLLLIHPRQRQPTRPLPYQPLHQQ